MVVAIFRCRLFLPLPTSNAHILDRYLWQLLIRVPVSLLKSNAKSPIRMTVLKWNGLWGCRRFLPLPTSNCRGICLGILGKTKGQQLKGKIVSEMFTLFRTFFILFQTFSPSKQRVLAQWEQKRRKDNKKNRTHRCCTLVVARLSSSSKRTNKCKEIWRDTHHLVDVSRLSRENVPSVPQTFCPNQMGTSRMSPNLPPDRPWDTSETTKFLYVRMEKPWESFRVICNLSGYFHFASLILETLRQYPLKQA